MVISTSSFSVPAAGTTCYQGWLEIFDDNKQTVVVQRYVLEG